MVLHGLGHGMVRGSGKPLTLALRFARNLAGCRPGDLLSGRGDSRALGLGGFAEGFAGAIDIGLEQRARPAERLVQGACRGCDQLIGLAPGRPFDPRERVGARVLGDRGDLRRGSGLGFRCGRRRARVLGLRPSGIPARARRPPRAGALGPAASSSACRRPPPLVTRPLSGRRGRAARRLRASPLGTHRGRGSASAVAASSSRCRPAAAAISSLVAAACAQDSSARVLGRPPASPGRARPRPPGGSLRPRRPSRRRRRRRRRAPRDGRRQRRRAARRPRRQLARPALPVAARAPGPCGRARRAIASARGGGSCGRASRARPRARPAAPRPPLRRPWPRRRPAGVPLDSLRGGLGELGVSLLPRRRWRSARLGGLLHGPSGGVGQLRALLLARLRRSRLRPLLRPRRSPGLFERLGVAHLARCPPPACSPRSSATPSALASPARPPRRTISSATAPIAAASSSR